MEEELENGIVLMEGILQNWENGNTGKYHCLLYTSPSPRD